jgi:2,3-bisphosphoglycerate-dependent phosphoglycerate mutase
VLKRAIKTYNNIVDEIDHHHMPVLKSYRLNERHYGGLTGLNKAETAKKHGEDQVLIWRRSFDVPPPALELDDERHPRFEAKYAHLPLDVLPGTESLKITIDRVLPYWFDHICPYVKDGKKVIVVAHGNSLRAIVKYLSKMSEKEIIKYNIPTGVPFVYEFDKDLNPIKNYYLLDDAELKRRQDEVANQGKA